ncbi:hypothetical protein [uncultured Adlercreutzia sp.]|uniref:hypothetical protein n=1 Tax=uncultured Adlercreutzia sp. TaxID=875803 RepID=UPI0025EAEAB7|nr:hypothetical protein [uncultured Adlercreutzia sp.]
MPVSIDIIVRSDIDSLCHTAKVPRITVEDSELSGETIHVRGCHAPESPLTYEKCAKVWLEERVKWLDSYASVNPTMDGRVTKMAKRIDSRSSRGFFLAVLCLLIVALVLELLIILKALPEVLLVVVFIALAVAAVVDRIESSSYGEIRKGYQSRAALDTFSNMVKNGYITKENYKNFIKITNEKYRKTGEEEKRSKDRITTVVIALITGALIPYLLNSLEKSPDNVAETLALTIVLVVIAVVMGFSVSAFLDMQSRLSWRKMSPYGIAILCHDIEVLEMNPEDALVCLDEKDAEASCVVAEA